MDGQGINYAAPAREATEEGVAHCQDWNPQPGFWLQCNTPDPKCIFRSISKVRSRSVKARTQDRRDWKSHNVTQQYVNGCNIAVWNYTTQFIVSSRFVISPTMVLWSILARSSNECVQNKQQTE